MGIAVRRLLGAAIGLLLVAGGAPQAAAGTAAPQATADPPGPPAVAYSDADHVVVTDLKGVVLSRIRRGFGGYSLGGDLLAKGYDTEANAHLTVGFDAGTGERRFNIRGTLLIPAVIRGGRAVAFAGAGRRDPNAASIWLRNRLGIERKLAQFSFGGGTGIPTGIPGGFVMEYGFDRAGDTAVVAAGDEIVGFEYDVWAIDTGTRDHVRLTRSYRSRYPTISPKGHRVVYFREGSICGGPMPGYRGGDLVMVKPDGTDRRLLHDGDCGRYFTRPRWIDNRFLVAQMLTRRGEDADPLYNSDLVLIDTLFRVVSQPISTTNRVGDFSVSPSMQRVAYDDWTRPEGFHVFTWKPADGGPGLVQEPWAQGTTQHFPSGHAPHLRGDSALLAYY